MMHANDHEREEPRELFCVGSTAAFHLETAQQLFASAEELLILVTLQLALKTRA